MQKLGPDVEPKINLNENNFFCKYLRKKTHITYLCI